MGVIIIKHWIFRILICLTLGITTTIAISWWCAYKFWQAGSSISFRFSIDDNLDRITLDEWEWLAANDPIPGMSYRNVTGNSLSDFGFSRLDYFVVNEFKFKDTTRPSNNVTGHSFGYFDKFHFLTVIESGWPMKVMHSQQWRNDPNRNPSNQPTQAQLFFGNPTPKSSLYSVKNGFVYPVEPPGPIVFSQPTSTDEALIEVFDKLYVRENMPPRVIPYGVNLSGLIVNTAFYASLWFLILVFPFYSCRYVLQKRRYRCGKCPICKYDLRNEMNSGCPECGWNRETCK